ncbi:MAG TPA: hypothetical protein VLA19_15260 [Herpetosiphonaceae bacterium]|nr:hypothetical protein [Herpetosiphonaceae bacterium]
MFLMWYDDDRKKTATEKIADALAAYEKRWGNQANLVLVNAADLGEAPKQVTVRPQPFIQRSNFYVGVEVVS